MKRILIGIAACLLVLGLAVTATVITGFDNARVHQHLTAEEKQPCEHGGDVFCTHLPLVMIETGGQEIPGKRIYDDDDPDHKYTTTPDGQDYVTGTVRFIDHDTTNNHPDDEASYESLAQIHVRGHSSRTFEKSSYALRLITEEGENNPLSVMGMDAHHEWAMHGPILDKTLFRNYMWYNIAGEIMDYAPNVRFCEAFVNGEYQGVYVMVETITGGKDGARLQISLDRKNNTYTGYLLCLDWASEDPLKRLDSFTKYARRRLNSTDIEIRYPGAANLTPELADAVFDDFSYFEKTIYSYDYNNGKYGYQSMIDVDSFVDYFILNEFTCNYDAGRLSTYIYKDISGKYRMCIWDFNSACDNYQEQAIDRGNFQFHHRLWYFMLMKDWDFDERIVSRYRELRKTFLSDEYLQNYIDDVIAYLGDAVGRNYERWGYMFADEYDMLTPAERNPHSYEEAVDDLKDFIEERGDFLDRNIEAVLQYGSEKRVVKFNESAN